MAIRGSKGHFYCIHRYFYLIFPKIGGGHFEKGGGARPNVAHRERTRVRDNNTRLLHVMDPSMVIIE